MQQCFRLPLACLIVSANLMFCPLSANASYFTAVAAEKSGDLEVARHDYQQAAQEGDLKAENNLARMLRDGVGGPIDLKGALRWFVDAANNGQVNAQTSLGDMYETGNGVPRDYGTALYWYRRAAFSGFFIGQLSLGELLEAGHGIKADRVAAVVWFRLASEANVNPNNSGYMAAKAKSLQKFTTLESQLSASEKSTAQEMANRWVRGTDLPDAHTLTASSKESVPSVNTDSTQREAEQVHPVERPPSIDPVSRLRDDEVKKCVRKVNQIYQVWDSPSLPQIVRGSSEQLNFNNMRMTIQLNGDSAESLCDDDPSFFETVPVPRLPAAPSFTTCNTTGTAQFAQTTCSTL